MTPATRYHHGNLRSALIDAAYELARAGGPDAVVLREASRQVGVSHNAAYRHFPDRGALIAAVAERCMRELADRMTALIAAVAPDDLTQAAAVSRLEATGRAYVGFALEEPGLFRTGFTGNEHALTVGAPLVAPTDPSETADPGPLEILGAQLDALVMTGAMPAANRPLTEFTAWSAVHGFSMLCLEGPLGAAPRDAREVALAVMLATISRGLVSSGGAGATPVGG